MSQGTLFDTPADLAQEIKSPRPGRVRRSDPDTSHAAARALPVTKANHRGRILLYLWGTEEGATADDLWSKLGGRAPHVAHTRASELAALGLVELTMEKRRISTGLEARVWRILPLGVATARMVARGAVDATTAGEQ